MKTMNYRQTDTYMINTTKGQLELVIYKAH